MEGPINFVAQNYQEIDPEPVKGMLAEYETVTRQIQEGQVAGRKALAPLMLKAKQDRQAELEGLIQNRLEADIASMLRNHERYALGAEAMRKAAKTHLAAAKQAIAKFQSSKKTADLEAAVRTTAAVHEKVESLHALAQKDSERFGKHWYGYRQVNPFTYAPNLPRTAGQKYEAGRGKMINDGKLEVAQLLKLKEMVTQTEALAKMAKTRAAGGQQGNQEAAFAESNVLVKRIETEVGLILNGGNGFKQSWHFTEAKYKFLHTDALDKTKNTAADGKNGEDRYADFLGAVKALKARIKSARVVLETGVKSFTKDERNIPGVKTQLKYAQDLFKKVEGTVVEIAAAEKQALKDITAIRQRCP